MLNLKLVLRNLRQDFLIYSLMILSVGIFMALIISFQSTILSGDLFTYLTQENISNSGIIFRFVLFTISAVQYLILFFFLGTYYKFINKYRIRELAIYKVTGFKRKTILSLLLIENLVVYLIILIFSIGLSLLISPAIITFTNNYLELEQKLSVSISPMIIIFSALCLLMIVLLNVLFVYLAVNRTDLKAALDNSSQEKQIKIVNKASIILNFSCALIILVAMTYTSTIANLRLYFGIILIGLFYAFGLYLLISALVNGYKYLVPSRKLNKSANLLFVNELNYHLHQSKLVIFSSVIFMMLSIGALLLSNTMNTVFLDTVISSDLRMQDNLLETRTNYWGLDNGIIVKDDNNYIPDKVSQTSYINSAYPDLELDNEQSYLLLDQNFLTNIESSLTNEELNTSNVQFNTDDGRIPVTIIIIEMDDYEYLSENIILFSEDVLNNNDSNYIKYIKDWRDVIEIINNAIDGGIIISDTLTAHSIIYNDKSVSYYREEEVNNYLDHLGQEQLDLADDEVIYNSKMFAYENLLLDDYKLIASEQDINIEYIANDELVTKINANFEERYSSYYTLINYTDTATEQQKNDLEKALANSRNFVNIRSLELTELMGNLVFLLLIAFYIALIFIVCNFTLIGINLCAHALDNRMLFTKLREQGLSQAEIKRYINNFINQFLRIPLVIGLISGLIVTNFALNLIGFSSYLEQGDIAGLIIKLMFLYLVLTIIFNQIIKVIYRKIVLKQSK